MGEPNNAAEAGKTPSFEEFKPMLRPTGIINGIIKVDVDKCTGCALCIENCALKCMEMDEAKHPLRFLFQLHRRLSEGGPVVRPNLWSRRRVL